jgi:hypothetical protein
MNPNIINMLKYFEGRVRQQTTLKNLVAENNPTIIDPIPALPRISETPTSSPINKVKKIYQNLLVSQNITPTSKVNRSQ